MVTFLEGTFDLFFFFFLRCSREIGGRRTRLWQRDTIIGIFGAVTEDLGSGGLVYIYIYISVIKVVENKLKNII